MYFKKKVIFCKISKNADYSSIWTTTSSEYLKEDCVEDNCPLFTNCWINTDNDWDSVWILVNNNGWFIFIVLGPCILNNDW